MRQLAIALFLEYEWKHSFEKNIMTREMFATWMMRSRTMKVMCGGMLEGGNVL